VLGSQPVLLPVILAVWVVVLLLTRWVALASMTAAASLPAAAYLLGLRGARLLWAAGLGAVVVLRHQANIRAKLGRLRRSRRRNGGAAESANQG
jgi:glycerol-3-phosphate acyltransferase PlsY